jgi:hypothetical protein
MTSRFNSARESPIRTRQKMMFSSLKLYGQNKHEEFGINTWKEPTDIRSNPVNKMKVYIIIARQYL